MPNANIAGLPSPIVQILRFQPCKYLGPSSGNFIPGANHVEEEANTAVSVVAFYFAYIMPERGRHVLVAGGAGHGRKPGAKVAGVSNQQRS